MTARPISVNANRKPLQVFLTPEKLQFLKEGKNHGFGSAGTQLNWLIDQEVIRRERLLKCKNDKQASLDL